MDSADELSTWVPKLVAKLQALRAQQASLAERYYERHPAMVDVQNQIATYSDLLTKAENQVISVLQTTLAAEQNDQNSLKVGPRGPSLLEDFHFREKIFHFDHERIPERVVHARGYGAHGFFEN